MPNSLQSSDIASPASRRATNCSLSSMTEHSFQGITPSQKTGGSVTYVSGTMCYLCLRPLKSLLWLSGCPLETADETAQQPLSQFIPVRDVTVRETVAVLSAGTSLTLHQRITS